jgi:hypothetical protein
LFLFDRRRKQSGYSLQNFWQGRSAAGFSALEGAGKRLLCASFFAIVFDKSLRFVYDGIIKQTGGLA